MLCHFISRKILIYTWRKGFFFLREYLNHPMLESKKEKEELKNESRVEMLHGGRNFIPRKHLKSLVPLKEECGGSAFDEVSS